MCGGYKKDNSKIILATNFPKNDRYRGNNIWDVTVPEIEGQSRKREFMVCRHTAMAIIYELTGITLKGIGRRFNNRDHSSIIHAIESIQDVKDTVSSFKKIFEEILEQCRIEVDRIMNVLDYTKTKTPVTQ